MSNTIIKGLMQTNCNNVPNYVEYTNMCIYYVCALQKLLIRRTSIMKKISIIGLSVLMLMCLLPINALAADDISSAELTDNSDKKLIDVAELTFELESMEITKDEGGSRSPVEKFTQASFVHNVYDRNGIFTCKLHTTIKGYYSTLDNWSEVTSVSAYLTNSVLSGLYTTTSKSGNRAYVYVKQSGVTVGNVKYKILTNGNIIQY